MENKYYTPELEDLFVGYECDVFMDDDHPEDDNWFFTRINEHWKFKELKTLIDNNELRTPYLSKEQIEKEGWEDCGHKLGGMFKKIDVDLDWLYYKVYYWEERKTLSITKYSKLTDEQLTNLPEGCIEKITKTMYKDLVIDISCPSINEFRKIIKLLGI